MESEWPVPPASGEERSCADSRTSPSSESLNALVGRLDQLIQALDKQNQMLLCMVDMNQQMLEELVGRDDEDSPTTDLSGKPLKGLIQDRDA
jgi:hypothetical protein